MTSLRCTLAGALLITLLSTSHAVAQVGYYVSGDGYWTVIEYWGPVAVESPCQPCRQSAKPSVQSPAQPQPRSQTNCDPCQRTSGAVMSYSQALAQSKQAQAAQSELADVKRQLTAAQSEIQQLRQQNQTLTQQRDAARTDTDLLAAQVQSLKNELSQARARPQTTPPESETVQALKQQVDSLKRERDQAQAQADSYQQSYEQASESNKALQAEIDSLKRQLDEAKRKPANTPPVPKSLQSLQQELEKVKAELAQTKTDAATKQAAADQKIAELTASLEKSQSELGAAIVERDKARQEAQTMMDQREQAKVQMALLREEIAKLQATIDQLKSKGDGDNGQAAIKSDSPTIVIENRPATRAGTGGI